MNSDAHRAGARQDSAGPTATRCTVEGFPLGPFETNCYIVYAGPPGGASGRACWIVDAGFDPEPLIDRVLELGLRPQAIVLTHTHADHIGGIARVLRALPGLPVWVHAEEAAWLADPTLNLSAAAGMSVTAPGADRMLEDGEELELDGSRWRVLHTPGHSPGGITLYNAADGQAIVGDALFNGSVGRTDFPGSDARILARSIKMRLYALPDDTTVFPGHGPPTNIGREKRSNPFVRA